jgi:hypothetical protein
MSIGDVQSPVWIPILRLVPVWSVLELGSREEVFRAT